MARGRSPGVVNLDLADEILDVLSRASLGVAEQRIDVDPNDLDDPLALIANAVNVLLDDLVYRQEEREEALSVAIEARAKEEFLSYISHDMQTPLALLVGTLSVLEDGPTSEEIEATVPIMRRATERLQRFVQQFLDLARLGADRPLVVQPHTVELRTAVRNVVELFADKGPVEVAIADDAGTAYADEERIEQILSNLVGNAFKHAGPRPGVAITTAAGPDGVRIHVEDHGRGMSEEEVRRVFAKYERGDAPGSAPGTGLGLYLSRALAEAQGGSLTVRSRRGEGSRFTLTLPDAPSVPD